MGVKEDSGEIVNAWPDQLMMRCYTQKEIHALSVKEITQIQERGLNSILRINTTKSNS